MKYPQIANLVYQEPWAIHPAKFAEILHFIGIKATGGEITAEEIEAITAASPASNPSRNGAVAVLPMQGVMAQRMNLMSAMSGGISTEMFGRTFNAAVADPSISAIVLDIDSPGGSVFGVQELWQTIMGARGVKPVVAFANSMVASAAYWIATAAQEIVVTPGGQVGSIGVLTGHSDISARLEMTGESVTLISAGKKKVDANPFEPLSDQARADLQSQVDIYYASFVGAVAQGRGVTRAAVRDGFGEGGMVGAEAAVTEKMADRVGTLDMAVGRAGVLSRVRAENWGEITVEDAKYMPEVTSYLLTGEERSDDDTDLRSRRLALQRLTNN